MFGVLLFRLCCGDKDVVSFTCALYVRLPGYLLTVPLGKLHATGRDSSVACMLRCVAETVLFSRAGVARASNAHHIHTPQRAV